VGGAELVHHEAMPPCLRGKSTKGQSKVSTYQFSGKCLGTALVMAVNNINIIPWSSVHVQLAFSGRSCVQIHGNQPADSHRVSTR
jgi:hypothetical protein